VTNPNKLTQKEESVLIRLLLNKTPKEIAEEDKISVNAIYSMLKHLRSKYSDARQFINDFDSRYRSKLRKYLW
jgi:DNA-binding CsgD family transcriptional regulator